MGKTTLRNKIQEQSILIKELIEELESKGFFCPYSKYPNEIGESDNMVDYNDEGKPSLPYFCSLRGHTDYWGEYDEDCDGAYDKKSCWLHYYETVLRRPKKFTPIRREKTRKELVFSLKP